MPDWNMAIAPDIGATVMNGFRQGQQERFQRDWRNALAAYATNPSDESLNALAQYDPQFVMQQKQAQQQQLASQQKQHQEQIVLMGKLLDHAKDPATYQQALAAAKQYGLDVSRAPQQFDPAWVSQQRLIVHAFEKDGGQAISGIARELIDAGYKPGTPEFQQAMAGVINNKYASEYVDEGGNTRRRSALNIGGGQQTPNVPDAAIQELRANPNTAPQFDEIFGPGTAASILGGPSQPATGGFQQ